MFIRVKTTPNSPRKSIQIVESVRDGDKVKQKIIRHVGVAMNDGELEKMKELAIFMKLQMEEAHQPSLFSAEDSAERLLKSKAQQKDNDDKPLTVDLKQLKEVHRNIVGIHEVYGEIYQQLGFDRIWGGAKKHNTRRETLKHITLARIAQPLSKRASVDLLETDFGVRLNLNTVYKMMDHLDEATIESIQDKAYQGTRSMLGESLDVLFYDCTTLYFESFEGDELRQKGFSKDHKSQQTQVLLALLVSREGLPVGYEVFPGATFEGNTLIPVVNQLRERYQLQRAVFVADRGLFSDKNLSALEAAGIEYVVGAKLKVQSKAIKEALLNRNDYTRLNDDTHYLSLEKGKGRRLIVSHSHSRAKKDAHERTKAITNLQKKLKKSKQTKAFVAASAYKKYLNISNSDNITVNETAIAESEQWDGLHGVITNTEQESVADILAHYRGLWRVEQSFRIQKHDLKVRPIYHWNESRIRAHLAIAFMAFSCVRHLEYRVALQYKPLSPEVIRRELAHVQMSLLEHKKTQSLYAMPSSISPHAEKIYKVLGLKPTTTPYLIK